jgi:hypothetical protein
MKTKLIAIVLALLGYFGVVHAQTLVTNLSSVAIWTDTGLYLTNSEWVDVNASGFWYWDTVNYTTDPDGFVDPGDNFDAWLQDDLHGSVIVFIGANPYQGSPWTISGVYQTNQYFQVGTAGQFMSNTNGELWLGINDDFSGLGGTNDNGGPLVPAVVSLGFSCDDNFTNMTLSVALVSSNLFSFYISNGIPNTVCAIYDSADLTHWTLLDTLILSSDGSSQGAIDNNPPDPDAGIQSGGYLDYTSVPYRFYKVSNGPFWSQPIGFERITVGAGTTNYVGVGTNSPGLNSMIADQLIAPANTLNALFDPMVDGSTLPNGSQILKWNGHTYNTYTYSSGSWSPNGNATLLPGEAAFLYVTNSVTVTFAGLVLEGCLTNYTITNNSANSFISSMIPQAGGLQTPLGYDPEPGDTILFWKGAGNYDVFYFGGTNETGLTYPDDWYDENFNPTNQPIINVGEAFIIQNVQTNDEYWIRKFPGCCDQ